MLIHHKYKKGDKLIAFHQEVDEAPCLCTIKGRRKYLCGEHNSPMYRAILSDGKEEINTLVCEDILHSRH